MGVRFSLLLPPFEAFFGFGALQNVTGLLSTALILAAVPSAVQASPDCSNPGLRPSSECITKSDYCKHTSILVVLAVVARESGLTESDNVGKLMANGTHETWYVRYRELVKRIVHQVYAEKQAYQKLRARIAPSMALALSALAAGCNADRTVTVEPR